MESWISDLAAHGYSIPFAAPCIARVLVKPRACGWHGNWTRTGSASRSSKEVYALGGRPAFQSRPCHPESLLSFRISSSVRDAT